MLSGSLATAKEKKKTTPGRDMFFIDNPAIEKLKYIHQPQHGGSQHHYLIYTS